ncbi:hypothetical protein BDR04DRAFT_1228557 [Suillus decipiens]|nr:hypothetical protein BDR04DRAFT_1228557 [Suillus decipiens]
MRFVRFFTCIVSCLSVARAFSVTVGAPTQCDPLNISWTGGQAPFEILLTPSLEPYHNYSVPTSAFSNGKGSYSISQLPFSTQTQFLLTMSDATGFGSGGTTNILIVGNQVGNNNCSTAVFSPLYEFELSPLPLTQCNRFNVTIHSGAILPVTITQLIPGGQPVSFNSATSSFTSVVDVNAETTLQYFVTDSTGTQGGDSGFQQVLGSNNVSCLSTNSPSSTAGVSATATAMTLSSSLSTSANPTNSSSSNVALIAGVSAAVVIVLVILGMYLWRKRRASRDVQSSTKNYPRRLQRAGPEYEVIPFSDLAPESPFPSKTDRFSYHTRPTQRMSDMTNSSASNFAVGARPPSFNQSQHSRQSSNTDFSAPVSYLGLPIQSAFQPSPINASAARSAVRDVPAPFGQTQPSNTDFGVYGAPQVSDITPIEHMAMRPRPASPSRRNTDLIYLTLPVEPGSEPIPASAGNIASPNTAYQFPTRIIMHTDAGDIIPDENGLVELPPQYSDHRRVHAV